MGGLNHGSNNVGKESELQTKSDNPLSGMDVRSKNRKGKQNKQNKYAPGFEGDRTNVF